MAIEDFAKIFRQEKGTGNVNSINVDLASMDGVDKLVAATDRVPVDVLMANAGCGLGDGFLDHDFLQIRSVIDNNVLGTTYLLHRIRARHTQGRILVAGSIAGVMPGSFQAVYNASKAY